MDDPHLDELMEHIDAAPIDIGQEQPASRTLRRMHVTRNHAVTPPPQSNIGNGDDDSFRLMLDESDNEYEEPVSLHIKRREPANNTANNDDYSAEPEPASGFSKDMLQETKTTAKRTRICYQQQASERSSPGEFRGRRGIAAEDLAELRRGGDQVRISFTPSEHSSPLPDIGAAFETQGQYTPLRMEPRADVPSSSHQQTERITQNVQAAKTRRVPVRQRRKHQRWSTEEEECFIKAVFKHGLRWSLIEDCHGTNGTIDQVLRGRNRVNLKDKARTIKLRLLRANKSLGPFIHASGHL
ncbi:hypothetical protein IW136_003125 [Coemansia sp. RSA 678]|nr:hypothetical protein IW136_003125 [Coemansia sp. RSA 678]